MTISIRRAESSDSPSLSRICLLTANAGTSAEHLHDYGELPGLVYAVPYAHLPSTFGFVLVEDETSVVVGYVLGSSDTRSFESAAEEQWWPPLRVKYPLHGQGKEQDKHYAKLVHDMHTTHPKCLEFSPAHLHINILPEYQRQGWGRKLIDKAVEYLEEQNLRAVWLGMDMRNEGARKFYERLGFEDIPGAPVSNMGLQFSKWRITTSNN